MKKVPISKKEEVLNALLQMPNWELAELFQELSESHTPFPSGQSFQRSRYYLGISTSNLEDVPRGKQFWGSWTPNAVAYAKNESYPSGAHGLLAQFGICSICQTHLMSSAKEAVCPICGTENYLT